MPHRDNQDPTRISETEWSECKIGSRLRLYRVEGGGHQLPSLVGAAPPAAGARTRLRNRDIETAEEVWSFFKSIAR